MTKAELDSKHIAELHALAAEAGVPKYRMLRREELIEALADGGGGSKPAAKPERKPRKPREPRQQSSERRERTPRPRRERRPREERPAREKAPAPEKAEKKPEAAPAPAAPSQSAATAERPRRRRRRRFGRKRKGVDVTGLLLPPAGRQALVYGESSAACTAMLREVVAELSGGKGPDPIVLLVDPSPEELAEWKREAPQAELVAAAQARHASDALAQAVRRAEAGEDVILLVDSLTKLEDADAAKEIFDGAVTQAKGSLTVVAALVRSA
jgi:hypothetical protein